MTYFLNWLSQIVAVTRFSLLSVPERKGAAIATVCGIAGGLASGVLCASAMLGRNLFSSIESSKVKEDR